MTINYYYPAPRFHQLHVHVLTTYTIKVDCSFWFNYLQKRKNAVRFEPTSYNITTRYKLIVQPMLVAQNDRMYLNFTAKGY